MKKSAILIVLIALSIGIITFGLYPVHWVIIFTIWATFLFALLVLISFGRKLWFFRKWLGVGIIIVFFLSGMLGHALHSTNSYNHYFSTSYLKGDYLIGEVVEFEKGDRDYNKAIIAIQKIKKPNKEIKAQGKLLCYIRSNGKPLSIGNVVSFQSEIQPIENKNNPGAFNAVRYWETQGIQEIAFLARSGIEIIQEKHTFSWFWTRSRASIIAIIKTHVSPENQGLVIALTLGNKSRLSQEVKSNFENAGAMYVLAVSGMHIGILLGFIYMVFFNIKILRKRNLYLFFSLFALWGYALLTGMSPSVIRAVTMFSLMVLGKLLGKRLFSLQSIFGSALILLLVNPLFLYDIGFQLSYLAVVGIAFFYRPIAQLFYSRFKLINYFWEGMAIGLAAQIAVVPLSLYYFHQFPNYFLLTNIGVTALGSIALISVVLLCILHFVPFLGFWMGYIVNFIFSTLSSFMAWINTLPAVTSNGFTPSVTQIILLYFGIAFLYLQWKKRKLKYFRIGAISLFMMAFLLIVQREYNKAKEELVVLNYYHPVVLLKENRQIFILYDSSEVSLRNLTYLTEGYQNKAGVVASKVPLSKNKVLRYSPSISFRNTKNGLKISYFDNKYILAERLNSKIVSSDWAIVKGEWNPYVPSKRVDFNTSKSALVVSRP